MIYDVEFTDGCGLTIRADDRIGTDSWVSRVDGWFDGADIRADEQDRMGDGAFPVTLWRKGRTLTLAGTRKFKSGEETVRFARQLSAAFRSGTEGNGSLRVVDDTGDLRALGLALDGRPKVAHDTVFNRVEYELPLIAPDPYLYGDPLLTQAFVQGTGTGLIFPLFDDAAGNTTNVLEFGDEQPPPVTLVNAGNAVAYPVVTVTGDMRSGFVLTLSGDKDDAGPWRVAWQMDTRPQSPVLVDFSGSVTVDGVDQSWALTERGWGGVRPGGKVTLSITPIAAGSGSAILSLRPTYL